MGATYDPLAGSAYDPTLDPNSDLYVGSGDGSSAVNPADPALYLSGTNSPDNATNPGGNGMFAPTLQIVGPTGPINNAENFQNTFGTLPQPSTTTLSLANTPDNFNMMGSASGQNPNGTFGGPGPGPTAAQTNSELASLGSASDPAATPKSGLTPSGSALANSGGGAGLLTSIIKSIFGPTVPTSNNRGVLPAQYYGQGPLAGSGTGGLGVQQGTMGFSIPGVTGAGGNAMLLFLGFIAVALIIVKVRKG